MSIFYELILRNLLYVINLFLSCDALLKQQYAPAIGRSDCECAVKKFSRVQVKFAMRTFACGGETV